MRLVVVATLLVSGATADFEAIDISGQGIPDLMVSTGCDLRAEAEAHFARHGREELTEAVISILSADHGRNERMKIRTDVSEARSLLEIGPGATGGVAAGGGPSLWTTVDALPYPNLPDHHLARWGYERLPFHDHAFDLIFASHALEHIPWHQTVAALAEARRCLKPGGKLEVWVPDLGRLIKGYLTRDFSLDPWFRLNPRRDPFLWFNGRVFSYGPNGENYHRAAFDAVHLAAELRRAGFVNVTRLTRPRGGHHHGWISLGMSGIAAPPDFSAPEEDSEATRMPFVRRAVREGTKTVPGYRAPIPVAIDKLNWVSHDEMTADVRHLRGLLPAQIDLVVGVPRSGMAVAAQLALLAHCPMQSLTEFLATGMLNLELVLRRPLPGISNEQRRTIVIVDDSVATGGSMDSAAVQVKQVEAALRAKEGPIDFVFACLYTAGEVTFDNLISVREIPRPRVFEWNFANHPQWTPKMAMDIDGVLCVDPTDDDNDDGPRYRKFLANARPLYLPKAYPVRALITSRLEKYRPETEDWLSKHGVQYKSLIMMPYATKAERLAGIPHGLWKAERYREIMDECALFVESDERQARQIAGATGARVLSIESMQMLDLN